MRFRQDAYGLPSERPIMDRQELKAASKQYRNGNVRREDEHEGVAVVRQACRLLDQHMALCKYSKLKKAMVEWSRLLEPKPV